MTKKEKTVGSEFCSDLYDVLVYATMKILNDGENQFKKRNFDYSELFEHFEMVADKFIALKRLIDSYDNLSSELVGFAITNDVEDFDIEFSLDNNVLLQLQEKIGKQIKYNAEHYNDIADTTEQEEIRTRKELLINFCAYLKDNVTNLNNLNSWDYDKQRVKKMVLIDEFLEEQKERR